MATYMRNIRTTPNNAKGKAWELALFFLGRAFWGRQASRQVTGGWVVCFHDGNGFERMGEGIVIGKGKTG